MYPLDPFYVAHISQETDMEDPIDNKDYILAFVCTTLLAVFVWSAIFLMTNYVGEAQQAVEAGQAFAAH